MASQFVYAQLQTSDPERAKEFYRSLFDWVMIEDPPGPGPSYTEVLADGDRIAGIMQAPAGGSPQWMPYISVDNVDAATAKAQGLGATVAVAPMDIPQKGCRISMLIDPTGVAFSLRAPLGGHA